MTVYGTRPEAIKMAPVISALQADSRFTSIVVSTGQHREMLDHVNKRFGIEPDYDLGLLLSGHSLNAIAHAMNPYSDGRAAEHTMEATSQLVDVAERIVDLKPPVRVCEGKGSAYSACH